MNIVNVAYDSTNYYVVEQNRTRLLIDVGWAGTLARLSANLRRKGIAFTGDLKLPTMVDVDQAEATELSWAKLRGLNVRTVYPGHGPVRPTF